MAPKWQAHIVAEPAKIADPDPRLLSSEGEQSRSGGTEGRSGGGDQRSGAVVGKAKSGSEERNRGAERELGTEQQSGSGD